MHTANVSVTQINVLNACFLDETDNFALLLLGKLDIIIIIMCIV